MWIKVQSHFLCLDSCDTCTANIQKSTGDVEHATLAVTVLATGGMILLFLIFKGRLGGQVEQEFSTFPVDFCYAFQKMHGWMNIL